jgi:hypothetical protein
MRRVIEDLRNFVFGTWDLYNYGTRPRGVSGAGEWCKVTVICAILVVFCCEGKYFLFIVYVLRVL